MLKRTPLNQRQKQLLWERQHQGICAICRLQMEFGRFEDDHHVALVDGGTNDLSNRRLVHPACHAEKSAREHKQNSKVKRLKYGRTRKGPPMPGSRNSRFKKHMDGSVSER